MKNPLDSYYDFSLSEGEIHALFEKNIEVSKPITDQYDEHTEKAKAEIFRLLKRIVVEILKNASEEKSDNNIPSQNRKPLEELKDLCEEENIDVSVIYEEITRYVTNEREKSRHKHLVGFYLLENEKMNETLKEVMDYLRPLNQ